MQNRDSSLEKENQCFYAAFDLLKYYRKELHVKFQF